jgi:hypothetical protein
MIVCVAVSLQVDGRADRVYNSFRVSGDGSRQVATQLTVDAARKLQRAFRVLSPHSESEDGSSSVTTEVGWDLDSAAAMTASHLRTEGFAKSVLHLSRPSAASVELAGVDDAPSEDMLRLPVGWGSRIDEASGRRYYYNITTGQSTWDKPQGPETPLELPTTTRARGGSEPPTASQQGSLITVVFNSTGSSTNPSPSASPDSEARTLFHRRAQFHQHQQHQHLSSAPGHLPEGWRQMFDQQSGRHYYYNINDGVSTWELPATGVESSESSAPRSRAVSFGSDVIIPLTPPSSLPGSPSLQPSAAMARASWGSGKGSVTIPPTVKPALKVARSAPTSSRSLLPVAEATESVPVSNNELSRTGGKASREYLLCHHDPLHDCGVKRVGLHLLQW